MISDHTSVRNCNVIINISTLIPVQIDVHIIIDITGNVIINFNSTS